MNRISRLLLPAAVAGFICQAQTQVNLQTQGRNIDFSQAPSTKPFKVGAALPGTCTVGETFFNTSAPAGANWYGCVAANVWAVQSGGGGITQLTGDVAAGPGSGAQAATIQPGSVTLNKMANLAAGSIICNNGSSAATPVACTPAQVNAMLAVNGGTGGPIASNQLTDFVTSKTSGTALTVNPGIYRVGYAAYPYAGSTTFALTQYPITAVSQAGQAVLTINGTLTQGGLHLGDTIYVSGAAGNGCTGLNALQTVVNTPSLNQITINWSSTGCTYTANSATFGANPGASGTGYIYGDNQGNLTLMMPASAGLVAVGSAPNGTPAPITIQSSTPGFGAGSVPIAQITLSSTGNGNWNTIIDQRAFMSTTGILAGAGLLTNEAGGIWTLGIDPSIVPELGAGNTWTGANDFSGANSTSPLKVSAGAPATCSVGQYYFNSANSHTYACTASNTWTQVDGAAGGSSSCAPNNNDIPKGNNSGACANSSIIDNGTLVSTTEPVQTTGAFSTPTANGQGELGASSTSGAVIGGQGSTADLALVNKSGQVACSIPTGTTNFTCPVLAATNTVNFSTATLTSPMAIAGTAPTTCSIGQYYFNSGNSHTYACTASNTWTQVDGGGGGSSTTTETLDMPVGTCWGGAFGALWWLTATSNGSCLANAGVNMLGAAAFSSSGLAAGRPHAVVPINWTGGTVNLYLVGENSSGTASATTFSVQTQCYSAANPGHTAYSPGTYNSVQTLTTAPASNGPWYAELPNLTMTGCSAGNLLDILVTKTSTNATDYVYGAYLTIVRNL